jgi:hypothetical protein
MTEPGLKYLGDQNILSELRGLRDDLKHLQARVNALEAQQDFTDALAVFRSAVAQGERGTDLSADSHPATTRSSSLMILPAGDSR